MAIVNNTLSEIGDVLIIDMKLPMVGVSAMTSFVDDLLGVSGTRTFTKEFSYSQDGINFTDWIVLSNPNLAAITFNKKQIFDVRFKYTRSGTDRTGLLTFNSVDLVGTFDEVPCGIVFDQSVFSYFFNSCNATPVLEWGVSVLEKLYKRGIVPSYIERGDRNNANDEDRDYIDFWTSVAVYFGLIVSYARAFEDFVGDVRLSKTYLENRGMIVCDLNEIDDLTYLMQNFWDEMRQRGTYQISLKKGDFINGTEKLVDGELLRLICFDDVCDEFLFSISDTNKVGWCVGEWSPLYRGIGDQDQLSKAYETGTAVVDLDNYPLLEDDGTIAIVSGVMAISDVVAGEEAGIANRTPTKDIDTIRVDPNVAYMLSFDVGSNTLVDAKMSVRMQGYDIQGNSVTLRDISQPALPAVAGFVEEYLNPQANQFYTMKFILYPHTQGYSTDPNIALPLMGSGQNIKMASNTCFVVPEIVLDNSGGGGVSDILSLRNIKFRPLGTEYSTGFIGLSDFVQIWAKNNNISDSVDDIEETIERKLINYGSSLKINYL